MQIQLSDHFTFIKVIRFTFPTIAMMIFTSVYSVVDGFFVSNFAGKTPFAAINLIMPVLIILGTVGFIFGTGGTALVGRTYFDGKAVRQACINGSSEFMSSISMSIVGILYNLQLMKYAGENGVAAYGVMMYVSMIFCAVFVGYSIGIAPAISYNDGAKNYDELKGLFRKSLTLIGLFSVCMIACAEIFARPLSSFFVGYDEQLFSLTVSGFRVFAISFGFMGFAVFSSDFFTALNDGLTSALISFLRTLVFESLSILILPLIFGGEGIWLSVVMAEFMAVVLGTLFLVIKRKKFHYW